MILVYTRRFRQDLRRVTSRRYDLKKLAAAVNTLQKGETLAPEYKDHALKGEFADLRECHIGFDWLLLYLVKNGQLILIRTGTHADIF